MTRSSEFELVRKEGKVWRGGLFSLAIANSPVTSEKVRVGIIASRKVGGAVVRNRSRRRMREIVRRHQSEIKNGVWLVLIVSSRAADATFQQLEHEYLRLAGRASILTP